MAVFVVDANVINKFQGERLADPGLAHEALASIFSCGHIALDEGGQCRQEWIECAAGTHPFALDDWINDRLVDQAIQLYPTTPDSMHKALTALGMPKKDHKWVRLAIATAAASLVTEDVDFIDPTKKKADEKTKSKLKATCKGPVSKALRKCFGVQVMCCQHVKPFCETCLCDGGTT